ncbi:MAG: neutral/alkaline non-lysosomal ceramidase N-terminal domain-containing protein, partial [Aldersonia sp.]|nr:neutral/alkaline non-lysosomal ceramidase N-terminal domain-containing protein [Aldersonia sp.]
VIRRLSAQFADVYHRGNVLLGATHTHAGPGGQSGHAMVDITTFGFRPLTFEAEVAGVVEAIAAAHDDLAPADLRVSRGVVPLGGGNRSPLAFDRNPAEDRALFPNRVDSVTCNLTVLRAGEPVGNINWFSTHGTSMSADNTLVSSDNKGYAAIVAETEIFPGLRGDGKPFVAAFGQATPGDISPNLTEGVTDDRFGASALIGRRQLDGALAAMPDGRPLGSGIDHRYRYVHMPSFVVAAQYTGTGTEQRLTPAMLGASFAAGSTEDGGGGEDLPFAEAEYGGNPAIAQLDRLVVPPELAAPQHPKDILLPMGLIDGMIQQILPFHLVRIGEFYLFTCPFEPTVNAGLRLRRAVAGVVGTSEDAVQVQGYTNGYGHYLTTPEEYDRQEYEGGSTVFGRFQLPAVVQIVTELARDLVAGRTRNPEGPGIDMTGAIPQSPVGTAFVDLAPPGRNFGDVLRAPQAAYRVGDRASAVFVAANPNNVLHRGGTYLLVERREAERWITAATDADVHTYLHYDKQGPLTEARIDWHIPAGQEPGTYRMRYLGDCRTADGVTTPFTGATDAFSVA